MTIIALDIGGTKITAGQFTVDGILLRRSKELLEGRRGASVGQLAAEMVRSVIPGKSGEEGTVKVGISIPGIVCPETGQVWAPNIPGWDHYPLKDEIHCITGIPSADISIESDRSCCIMGEIWKGAAVGCSNALFIAVGTGIGVGMFIDGRILHGFGDIAGASGWMALETPYDHKFDACGCFEYYASGNGIGARAREMIRADRSYEEVMKGGNLEKITAHDVFRLYAEGDTVAVKVLDKAVQMWGMASANLVSLLNPEKIIWGGGIFGPACKFLDNIYREAKKWAQPVSIHQVTFEASRLGENAALYGAAKLAVMKKNII